MLRTFNERIRATEQRPRLETLMVRRECVTSVSKHSALSVKKGSDKKYSSLEFGVHYRSH